MIVKTKHGFTLIELLVVMAILGILAAIGLGSFRTAQMKGRDAVRKHDLEQIEKALEMFYNDNGRYRTSTEGLPSGEWRSPEGTLYIKEIPSDPKIGAYPYESDDDGKCYKIYARLENTQDRCFTTKPTYCTDHGTTCGGASCNYVVTSQNVRPDQDPCP